MNLLHLKYAVEIADTSSMTKAAERLYTAQPNLSRAIRELESTLDITIFKRTSKGIIPTPEGEEFIGFARKILAQVDEIEAMYHNGNKKIMQFSISVPRASYISCAFTEFIKSSGIDTNAEVYYKETNSLRAIRNITNENYKLGIVRYQSIYEDNFMEMFEDKGLNSEVIFEFNYKLLFSSSHPLASKSEIRINDLTPYTEIIHADPYVPTLSLGTVLKNEFIGNANKRIFIYERGSQMDLLSNSHDTFMWGSPVPKRLLDLYSLVQKTCPENDRKYRDVLIYKKDYTLTNTDKSFIGELMKIKRELL
jgi:DNA-binding transcriptional LysR family regulator